MIKIASLILAIVMWAYLMNTQNPTVTTEYKNVEVQLLNTAHIKDQKLVIVKPLNPTVNIRVTGTRNTIFSTDRHRIIATCDLNGVNKDNPRAKINISVPTGLQVDSVSSDFLDFEFDQLSSKTIKIKPNVIGNSPEEDLNLDKVDVKPSSVLIEGPQAILSEINEASVNIDLSTIIESQSLQLPISIKDIGSKVLEQLSLSPKSVDVDIKMNYKMTVPIVCETNGLSPDNIQILEMKPKPEKVTISGSKQILQKIKQIHTMPIDLRNIHTNMTIKQELSLPEGVQVVGDLKTIEVQIKTSSTDKKIIPMTSDKIVLENTKKDFQYQIIEPQNFNVELEGTQDLIQAFDENSLKAYIDVASLEVGEHQLDLNFKDLGNLTIDKNKLPKVKIFVSKKDTENHSPQNQDDHSSRDAGQE